jgi:hypothetical protein
MTHRTRLVVGLAITGAIPLTVGVILWVIGSAMRTAYHGGWSGPADVGEVMVLAGLVCGLALFVFAAAEQRRMPRGPTGWADASLQRGEQALMPLDSPEHQAFLADPQPMPVRLAGPGVPPGGVPPADPVYPQAGEFYPPAGEAHPLAGAAYPPAGQVYPPAAGPWPDQGMPQAWIPPPGLGAPTGPGYRDNPEFPRERGFPVPPEAPGEAE